MTLTNGIGFRRDKSVGPNAAATGFPPSDLWRG
jgi:hypothetical protein